MERRAEADGAGGKRQRRRRAGPLAPGLWSLASGCSGSRRASTLSERCGSRRKRVPESPRDRRPAAAVRRGESWLLTRAILLQHVGAHLAAAGRLRLALLVTRLLVVLVLAGFLQDAGLLELLLEALERLIERLVLLHLDLSQLVHPFRKRSGAGFAPQLTLYAAA